MEQAIRLDVTLHAYMFMQSGIPVLYSGDEIGQLNDYSYKEDPDKAADSRYIHRGKMNWTLAKQAQDEKSVEGRIFSQLDRLEKIRKSEKVFVTQADSRTIDTGDRNVLCIGRAYKGEELLGLFNFSGQDKKLALQEPGEAYVDLIAGGKVRLDEITLPAYGFCYLKAVQEEKAAAD